MRYLAALVLACLLSSIARAQITPPAYQVYAMRYSAPYGLPVYAAPYPAYYPPAYPGYGLSYGELRLQRELKLLRWDAEDAEFRQRWSQRPRRY